MIDSRLFCYLYNIFPDSFLAVRDVETFDYIPGEWGVERISKGYSKEILADCILTTAQAISRDGKCIDDAFKYLDTFKTAKVQKQELNRFN